jgi:putative SOS response-associated peptidase YedK
MCGRSSLYEDPRELLESYGLPPRLDDFVPRYNIAPSQNQWGIRKGKSGGLEACALKWGLVPAWTNDPSIGARMINARAETVAEKPAFRDAFRTTRCLIIADGYYEWARSQEGKMPYRFQLATRKPFVFAGLWSRWDRGTEPIESCTIVTAPAGPATSHIHDRVPVILEFNDSLEWLDPKTGSPDLLELLHPLPEGELEIYAVSRAVNGAANDTEKCIEPVTAAEAESLRNAGESGRSDSVQLHLII